MEVTNSLLVAMTFLMVLGSLHDLCEAVERPSPG